MALQLVAVSPHTSPPIVLGAGGTDLGRVRECKVLDVKVSKKQCSVTTLAQMDDVISCTNHSRGPFVAVMRRGAGAGVWEPIQSGEDAMLRVGDMLAIKYVHGTARYIYQLKLASSPPAPAPAAAAAAVAASPAPRPLPAAAAAASYVVCSSHPRRFFLTRGQCWHCIAMCCYLKLGTATATLYPTLSNIFFLIIIYTVYRCNISW